MKDRNKTKPTAAVEQQLMDELAELRQRVAELEAVETERKQVEEALRESEELLNNILTASSIGIAHAKDRNIIWANEAMVRMFGFTRGEQYLGKDTQILYASEEEYRRIGRITYEQQRAGKVIELDAKFKRQDGSLFDGYVRINALDPLDSIKGIIVSIIDITERKRAEEALHESETRYRELANSVTDVFFAMDMDLRYTYWNAASEILTGIAAKEAHGKSIHEIFPDDENTRRAVEVYQEVLKTRQPQNFVNEYHLAGKDIVFEISAYPTRDGISVFAKDITERQQAEEEIRKRVLEQKVLREAMLALTTTLDRDEVIDRILAQLQEVVPYDTASVQLLREGYLEIVGGRGFPNLEELLGVIFDPNREDNPNREVVRTHASLIVDDAPMVYEEFLRDPHAPAGIRSWLGVPMLVGERLIGMIALDKSEPGLYTQEHVQLAEAFAAQAAIAIENAQLFEQARQEITEREQAEAALREQTHALRESEERYRRLAENAQDLIYRYRLTPNPGFEYVSPAAIDITGYTPEEHYADPKLSFEIVHPDDRPQLEKYLQGEGMFERPITLRWAKKDGTLIWTEQRNVPIYDAAGNLIAIEGIARDITERHRAEEALRGAHEQLTATLDALPDLLFEVDRDGRIYDYRASSLERLYAPPEQFLGKTVREVLPEAAADIISAAIAEAAEHGRHSGVTYSLDMPTGLSWFELSMAAKGDPHAPDSHFIVLAHNITERKQAEEERERLLVQIQEQARRIEQIMDTVPEGVLLLNADGRVMLANPIAERDLAVLADARVGDTITRLGDCPLAELLTSPPKGLWHEVRADASHGQGERIFEVIARPMENGPEPEDWVLVTSDVTREREIQQRVQLQERLAAVGQLAAGIAHDFNNIMATIVLYAQMSARAEGVSDLIRGRMETINQQAKHATSLIQQILDFSRRAVLERRPLDLLPFLKEQVKLLERTLPEHIEIELAYELDAYMINADPTRMQQMVTNLAVNARDAMPGGGTLRIGLERIEVRPGESPLLPEMESGEWVQVTVSDTGTGIPPDALPHIFEPFFTTKAPLGSGLGLPQVHGIVGQHGGRIDVETHIGKGTTFTIYLPALLASPSKPSGISVPGGLPTLPTGKGKTILVVEDNAVVRKALVESLELLNYRTREAMNGWEALAMLEQHGDDVDLLLSDVVMPGMGGKALLHALRERAVAVPVVMLTGHPLEKEMEELRAQGMADWLPKPPALEDLAEVVARALGTD